MKTVIGPAEQVAPDGTTTHLIRPNYMPPGSLGSWWIRETKLALAKRLQGTPYLNDITVQPGGILVQLAPCDPPDRLKVLRRVLGALQWAGLHNPNLGGISSSVHGLS